MSFIDASRLAWETQVTEIESENPDIIITLAKAYNPDDYSENYVLYERTERINANSKHPIERRTR